MTTNSVLDSIATDLPTFQQAVALQEKAATIGFDWPNIYPVFDKLFEEVAELRAELTEHADHERICDELGDVLFVCANIARHLKINPETALQHANIKFAQRFRDMEQLIHENHRSQNISLDEMEVLWNKVKAK